MEIIEVTENKKNIFPEYQGKGYAKAMIDFIISKYREEYSILQVGTGDSLLTIPFYEKCGFARSHIIPDFFTDNYNHPIFEGGFNWWTWCIQKEFYKSIFAEMK